MSKLFTRCPDAIRRAIVRSGINSWARFICPGQRTNAVKHKGSKGGNGMSKLRINIDGIEVTGCKGQTILQVAMENGIEIPNLCHDDRLKVYGACGLCVVEVEGVPKLLRACATEVSDNMVVTTRSERIDQSRKTTLNLCLQTIPGTARPLSAGMPGGNRLPGLCGAYSKRGIRGSRFFD